MTMQAGLVLLITAGAVSMDLCREKIDNMWIISAWMIGFYWQIIYHGAWGFGRYLTGALLPLILLYPLFVFRMLGAGDIKLFSAIGCIMGVPSILQAIALSFFLGAILSAAFLISCGNIKPRLTYLANYLADYHRTGQLKPYCKRGKQVENIHFTIPIFLGMILYAGGFY